MKILLLAPHPLYQDRGTPIAVSMLLKVLSEMKHEVDVVTYHEGKELNYDHVKLHRIPRFPFVRHIRPGFSWKKVVCDVLMLFVILPLVCKRRYQLVHAVEESVFIARLLKSIFKIPYVYDMDSSLPQQMVEKYASLAPLSSLLQFWEGFAVRGATAVVPVCEALAEAIARYDPSEVVVLNDVSLLQSEKEPRGINLKDELAIDGLLIMYVGNLEVYQGIDLLLNSFAAVKKQSGRAMLVIIGGETADIRRYRKICSQLGVLEDVYFLGPKPVEHLAAYLSAADILVSPRIEGKNTPMKIYSYLHSGKAILATNLPAHTQVLDDRIALLADISVSAFAKGMQRLIEDKVLRAELGQAGRRLVEENYSYPSFRERVQGLYERLAVKIEQQAHKGDQ